jgi:hypothetical protein
VSLSSDPAFSALKEYFVCGVKDITGASYAGMSGFHDKNGNAVNTSNGAGPHNVQLFMLADDGTILNCLPGYWCPGDLVTEIKLAEKLNEVWHDPKISAGQKEEEFREMQLGHIRQHPKGMSMRSRMQGFDQQYEAKYHLNDSDTIRDPSLITDVNANMLPQAAFKSVDELMHERLAKHPFQSYYSFDIASFVEYGRPLYDKKEDEHDPTAHLPPAGEQHSGAARHHHQQAHETTVNRASYIKYYGQ